MSVPIAVQPAGDTQRIPTGVEEISLSLPSNGSALLTEIHSRSLRPGPPQPPSSVLGFYNVFLPSDRSIFEGFQPHSPFVARVLTALNSAEAIWVSLFFQKSYKGERSKSHRDGGRNVCDSERLLLVVSEAGCGA